MNGFLVHESHLHLERNAGSYFRYVVQKQAEESAGVYSLDFQCKLPQLYVVRSSVKVFPSVSGKPETGNLPTSDIIIARFHFQFYIHTY